MIFAETTDVLQVQKILDLLKEHFGITCSIEDFVNSAIREKIEKIKSLNLDVFVDDLEEIFLHHDFPKIKKILFGLKYLHGQ